MRQEWEGEEIEDAFDQESFADGGAILGGIDFYSDYTTRRSVCHCDEMLDEGW